MMNIEELKNKMNDISKYNNEKYQKMKNKVKTIGDFLNECSKNPEAVVLIQVPKGNDVEESKNQLIELCPISASYLIRLLPINTIISNSKYIILSPYSKEENYGLSLIEGETFNNNVNKDKFNQFIAKDFFECIEKKNEEDKDIPMFLEFIPDNQGWSSILENDKVYSIFNVIKTQNFSPEEIYYITPHY